jgi:putative redox protein
MGAAARVLWNWCLWELPDVPRSMLFFILPKKRVDMHGFEVIITGQIAETHPKRYTHLDIEYVVEGNNVSPKAVEQAIMLSVGKYCSAIASMNATVNNHFRINGTEKKGCDFSG